MYARLFKLRDANNANFILTSSILPKVDTMIRFMNIPHTPVSLSVLDFANEYLGVVVKQCRSINFQYDFEPHLQSYNLVINAIKQYSANVLPEWWVHLFKEVEMVLTLINFLADYYNLYKTQLNNCGNNNKMNNNSNHRDENMGNHQIKDPKAVQNTMNEILEIFLSSNVYQHPASIVQTLYFEILSKFERLIAKNPKYINQVLLAFQSEKGIKSPSPKIRSRCLQIFCRFIKSFKPNLNASGNMTVNNSNLSNEMLTFIQQILEWAICNESLLSKEDMNALYESYSVLIISSNLDLNAKKEAMEKLLLSLVTNFQNTFSPLQDINKTQTINYRSLNFIVTRFVKIINYIIRTTKAFSNHSPMKQSNLENVYACILDTLLSSLDFLDQNISRACSNNEKQEEEKGIQLRYAMYSGVRQYFHVMVVCLEESIIIPYVTPAFEKFIKFRDFKNVSEIIPLLNQVTTKFKKNAPSLINALFMPLVTVIFELLNKPLDADSDPHEIRERLSLQRSYYSFLSHLINQNNMVGVLVDQGEQNMKLIIESIIQGVIECQDPIVQKSCFMLLRKWVDLWMNSSDPSNSKPSTNNLNLDSISFSRFVYSTIFPACFSAPLKMSFDLKDAQTIQALNECALCFQLIHRKGSSEFENVLVNQIFPSMNITNPTIQQQFVTALRSDIKSFKTFLKEFYSNAKSIQF
ncbi:unnamed protein product [Gordionus sp. m RMFG-2023]